MPSRDDPSFFHSILDYSAGATVGYDYDSAGRIVSPTQHGPELRQDAIIYDREGRLLSPVRFDVGGNMDDPPCDDVQQDLPSDAEDEPPAEAP